MRLYKYFHIPTFYQQLVMKKFILNDKLYYGRYTFDFLKILYILGLKKIVLDKKFDFFARI